MALLQTLPPDAHCDNCGKSVELEQVQRSANANNGATLGPWLCVGCEVKNSAEIQRGMVGHEHDQMVQTSYFENICNEVDPKLAEAIHRARLT